MKGKIKLSPALVFLLCILVYYGWESEVCCYLAAAILHELGHLIALRLCRCEIQAIRVGIGGACIETGSMTYRQEIICAAAGPMANLLLMLFPSRLFMVCNLLVLVFNLLPIEPLDGGKILGAVTARRWPLYQKAILDLAEILSALVLLLSGLLAGMFLPYGHRPAAFAIGLLIRACFFRMKTVQ